VLALKPGAGVVTTRGHVDWVVTSTRGQPPRQDPARAGEALISIAHPDFRPALRRELVALRHFPL